MLRRYFIVNGISTALLYASIWVFVPSAEAVKSGVSEAWVSYISGDSVLGPMFNRVVLVGAEISGVR